MFVEKVKNNGTDYLRLVEGVRITNKDGYKTTHKKVILNIGPLKRFDDGQPDYVERLKKSFKAGNPLIPAILRYSAAGREIPLCHQRKQSGLLRPSKAVLPCTVGTHFGRIGIEYPLFFL